MMLTFQQADLRRRPPNATSVVATMEQHFFQNLLVILGWECSQIRAVKLPTARQPLIQKTMEPNKSFTCIAF